MGCGRLGIETPNLYGENGRRNRRVGRFLFPFSEISYWILFVRVETRGLTSSVMVGLVLDMYGGDRRCFVPIA